MDVVVGLRSESRNRKRAENRGLRVTDIPEAVQTSDIIMLLIPDEEQPQVYLDAIAPHLRTGQALVFGHGFNIHYQQITPPSDIDVILVAPKGPGHMVRRLFAEGAGLPGIFAVQQDFTNQARDIALAYAAGIGCTRAGVLETTFKEETETDLFGEQTSLCGGLSHLLKASFDTLVDAGYQPEVAYFETVHEVKLIMDLIYEGGFRNMHDIISNTAEYGEYISGPRIITEDTKASLRGILERIQTGEFAQQFIAEAARGSKTLEQHRAESNKTHLEHVGQGLRAKMSFLRVSNEAAQAD